MIRVPGFIEPEEIPLCLGELRHLEQDNLLQRYDNPFESKQFLVDKANLPVHIHAAFAMLKSGTTQWWISHLLGVPITTVDFSHYGGLFIYEPGDYLKPHVDAGMHPKHAMRKIATALLYLTPASLETYTGTKCTEPEPLVWSRDLHTYKPGDLVIFSNHDTAWHGVPTVTERRVVLTVSYLAADLTNPRFTNPRTRAYFCKTTWEKETPELRELRSKRASEEEHSEVYRHGQS